VSGSSTGTGALVRPRHVIAVPDLARSAAWYRDVLGFEVHEVGDPGWRWYQRDEPWGMRELGVRTIDGHRMMFGEAVGDVVVDSAGPCSSAQ
jgi:catechol 2,3-dioxygenase-like lactoylglutathione lyase family enzyme